jgi:hypothetical protein
MGSDEETRIFLGKRELNDQTLSVLESMFPRHIHQHLVETIFQVGQRETAHAIGKPGNPSTQILDHLQADVGMLQYQVLEAFPGKPADEAFFDAQSAQRVVDSFAEHSLAQEITGLANVESDFRSLLVDFAQSYPTGFDENHLLGRVSLPED